MNRQSFEHCVQANQVYPESGYEYRDSLEPPTTHLSHSTEPEARFSSLALHQPDMQLRRGVARRTQDTSG